MEVEVLIKLSVPVAILGFYTGSFANIVILTLHVATSPPVGLEVAWSVYSALRSAVRDPAAQAAYVGFTTPSQARERVVTVFHIFRDWLSSRNTATYS